jgi:hypothetical protein
MTPNGLSAMPATALLNAFRHVAAAMRRQPPSSAFAAAQRLSTSRNHSNTALTAGFAAVLRTPRDGAILANARRPDELLGLNLAISSAV